ncbi:MAG: SpoIVB peptidase S55 domain-containing protein [Bacillota bacterium]|nr:SpoIVB peptidase S55 domain-containing protein [Bacillota bacterium]
MKRGLFSLRGALVGAVVLTLLILWPTESGEAAPASAFLPVAQVQKGARGIGKTVLHGTAVENFDVEVLGVVTAPGPAGDLILVRVSGPLIDEAGGIAAGMSGSPVYIDGRLVGALSFAFDYTDHRIGFVTPIADMLQVLELVRQETYLPLTEPLALDGRTVTGVSFVAAGEAVTPRPDTLTMVPVATPVLVSGLNARALERLRRVLAPYNLQVIPLNGGGGLPQGGGKSPDPGAGGERLQPGSAIGLQLVRGDVEVTALGTVTYVEGDRFLAFGHPFMSRGAANFFATRAYIHLAVPSLGMPFKIGTSLNLVGTVTQDRAKGVAGVLGRRPLAIPVHVRVVDRDRQRQSDLYVEVIQDEQLSLDLLGSAALQALDLGFDRIGRGTARVRFQVEGEGLPQGGFTRENIFYSDFDIAALSLGEFMEGLDMVLNNEFQSVRVKNVSLTVEVSESRNTARIEKVIPARKEIHPGESVELTVLLRPYRQEPVKQTLRLDVPLSTPPGTVTVTVRGGADLGYGEELPPLTPSHQGPEKKGEKKQPEKEKKEEERTRTSYESLGKLIDDFVRREKNSDLIAEFVPLVPGEEGLLEEGVAEGGEKRALTAGPPLPPAKPERAPAPTGNGEAEPGVQGELPPVKALVSTPYYIEGLEQFDLTITPWPENSGPGARPLKR